MIKEIQHLSACYNPGAELWIVPASTNSSWFKKLNWYCSSQLTIWNYKEAVNYSNKLKNIIESESLPFKDTFSNEHSDILVDTSQIFPNRAVLALDVSKGLNNWFSELNQKSIQLKAQTIRIFWGQNQLTEFIKGLNKNKEELSELRVEVVTCEPDRL